MLRGLFDAVSHCSFCSRKILFRPFECYCQQRHALIEIVVEFPGDPTTFLLVSLNQSTAHAGKSFFCKFTLSDVQNLSHEITRLVAQTPDQGSATFGSDDAPTLVQAALLNFLETCSLLKRFSKPL